MKQKRVFNFGENYFRSDVKLLTNKNLKMIDVAVILHSLASNEGVIYGV